MCWVSDMLEKALRARVQRVDLVGRIRPWVFAIIGNKLDPLL